MTDYVKSINNSLYCFGGGIPVNWGEVVWGSFDWGTDPEVIDKIDKYIFNSEIVSDNISKETVRYIYNVLSFTVETSQFKGKFITNTQYVTDVVFNQITKIINNNATFTDSRMIALDFHIEETIPATMDLSQDYLTDPTWYYDFTYPSSNAVDRPNNVWVEL
jgi:hypothetical protein